MGCRSTAGLLLGAEGMGERVEGGVEEGRACWGHGGGGRVLGHHRLRAGGIELPPLVIKNRSLMLPLNPSPGHQVQSVNALLSQTTPGCVTRHTRHASVTHFRPISGNIVEVTLMTPPIMYINSHTKL